MGDWAMSSAVWGVGGHQLAELGLRRLRGRGEQNWTKLALHRC